MSSEVSVFEFAGLDGVKHKVRTIHLEGKPWFSASDVCKALKMDGSATRWTASIPGVEKRTVRSSDIGCAKLWDMYRPKAKPPSLSIISEPGLYLLILRSDKPNARPFQDWVTRVVLPTIRKEGVYVRDEEKIATAESVDELEALEAQILAMAERKSAILAERLAQREARIAELEPKAEAFRGS